MVRDAVPSEPVSTGYTGYFRRFCLEHRPFCVPLRLTHY